MIKLLINRCIAKDYLYLFIYNDYVTGSTGKKKIYPEHCKQQIKFFRFQYINKYLPNETGNSFLIKQSSETYEKVHVYIDIRL